MRRCWTRRQTPARNFHYINRSLGAGSLDACGSIGSMQVVVSNGDIKTIAPDRTVVMSYFKGCPSFVNRYSQQQVKRMRNALINGNRRELVRVQLGETAYPGEVVAAVWDPNPNGQYMSYGNRQLVLWGHTREQIDQQYDESWQQGWKIGSMALVKF